MLGMNENWKNKLVGKQKLLDKKYLCGSTEVEIGHGLNFAELGKIDKLDLEIIFYQPILSMICGIN